MRIFRPLTDSRYNVIMSVRQICDTILYRHLRLQSIFAKRLFATEPVGSKNEVVDIIAADEKPVYSEEDMYLQEEIEKKRNKSRLQPQHRNMLMGIRPYDSPIQWYHSKVKYKKRMLGRYGFSGNDEPVGFAWPTPEEVKDAQEYERVAYPLSLQESWKKLEEEKRIKAEQIKMREAEIFEKVGKMKQWTAELQAKIAKKTAILEATKLRKERLIEEVRNHFGFKISPNDERFKEMVAEKEKQERKKNKEAKKQARMEKLKTMFQEKAANNEQTTESKNEQTTESKNEQTTESKNEQTKPVE